MSIENSASRGVAGAVALHWHEDDDGGGNDRIFNDIKRRLLTGVREDKVTTHRRGFPDVAWLASVAAQARRCGIVGPGGLSSARTVAVAAPADAVYLNVSQFPLWIDGYFSWLRRRPDVRAVFFLHDLLPLDLPEFFPRAEHRRHAARLKVLARYAHGIITTSDFTADAISPHLKRVGRRNIPVLVAALPTAKPFARRMAPDPELATAPFFVAVGTIEPRKNHLLLLNVWRELAARMGPATPKLLLAGTRGWDCENVVDMLERCPALQPHVIEAVDLPTPALRRVLASARALLMPSFAEGFGLPVLEARALGVPVIASRVAAFQSLACAGVTLIDPIDGIGWLEKIYDFSLTSDRVIRMSDPMNSVIQSSLYFDRIEHFIGSL